jgi:hypothetical protein
MRTKIKVPFVVAIESIKLAKSWIDPFVTPSEPPILKMDLVKLARLEGGAEAVDSAPIDIYIVLVPSSPNLVEIPEGQPSHPGGWFEGHKLRKEVIFPIMRGRAIYRGNFEISLAVAIENMNIGRKAEFRDMKVGHLDF